MQLTLMSIFRGVIRPTYKVNGEFKQTRRGRQREHHLKMSRVSAIVSAIVSQLFKSIILANVLKLSWN